jgi:hypothetical protein
MYRGSRKHVLDWTAEPYFIPQLLELLLPVDVQVTGQSRWMPRGYRYPDEARLESFGPTAIPGAADWQRLSSWWLRHTKSANTPNWDIALSAAIEGRPGLVLVEAKAHCMELSTSAKWSSPRPSVNSRDNGERIAAALNEANAGFRELGIETRLSVKHCYQMANRLAFTWRLATMGIPTVLLYLGFTGDAGISDVGTPIQSDDEWRSMVCEHLRETAPGLAPNTRLQFAPAPGWLLLRSRAVLEYSPGPAAI